MVLGKKEKILSEKPNNLGYISQFNTEATVSADDFLEKMFSIFDKYYPSQDSFSELKVFWLDKLTGPVGVNLIYIVQCSLLRQVNKLDKEPKFFDNNQLETIFGIIWDSYIEPTESNENNITPESLGDLQEKLIKILNIKFDNPLQKAYDNYLADQSDSKKKLKIVLQEIVIDIYNKSKQMAETRIEK